VFRLKCRDTAGNTLVVGPPRRGSGKIVLVDGAADFGGALEFTTEETEDTSPPVITSGPTLVSRASDTVIIEWTTDEPSDSFVDYGVADLGSTTGDAEHTQEHRVFLTGLSASTSYTYLVRSTDFSGNAPVTSSQLSFTTTSAPDLTPPQLLVPPQVIYVDDKQAIVTWSTDEATSPLVDYGQSLPDRVLFDDLFATEHSVHLTGLEPSTVYQVQVTASDPGNNSLQSEIFSLTTAPAAGVVLPQITDVEVSSIGDVSAVVSWQTDVAANRFVYYGAGDTLDLAAGDTDFGSQHSVVLTNLTPSTTYQYSVEAVDPTGSSSGRTPVATFTTAAAPDAEAPPSPSTFTGLIGLETSRLSWASVDASDLASYTVYRQISTAGFVPIATGLADTSYVDEGLVLGPTFTYYVTATDINGNESAPSDEDGGSVSIRNAPSTVFPVSARSLGPVTTLTASNAVAGSRGGPLTYTFHVSTSEVFDDVVASESGIAEGSGQTTWSFAKELEEGRDYFWRARANDGVFDGPWSFPSFFATTGGTPGDFDGSGSVDFGDFFAFVDVFGKADGDGGYDSRFDLAPSGRVDFDDFFAFVDVFGIRYSGRPVLLAREGRPAVEPRIVTFLDRDDVVVDVTVDGPVAGAALAIGYDGDAVEVIEVGAASNGLLRGLAAGDRLFGQLSSGDDEITLFAHRLDGGLAADGTLFRLRLRPRRPSEATWVEVRQLSTVGEEGVHVLEGPQAFRVELVPGHFELHHSYPNPFNPETTIVFDIPQQAAVRLRVHDMLGQRVRTLVDGSRHPGRYRVVWDGRDDLGRNLASGVYFAALEAAGYRSATKVLLVR